MATKTEPCYASDRKDFESSLLKLVRDVEEVKAEICQSFRKRYETYELFGINTGVFRNKLLGLSEQFNSMDTSLSPVTSPTKGKLKRVKLLLSCCDWLLSMDEEYQATKMHNKSNEFEAAVKSYKNYEDLGNKVFDSFSSEVEVWKEFPVVEAMTLNINATAADFIVKMKKIFYGNVMWTKNSVETKLMMGSFRAESKKWMEVLMSLEKMNLLENLIGRFFSDLMTILFHPIMKSLISKVIIQGHELVFKHCTDPSSSKPLCERVCMLSSALEYLFKNATINSADETEKSFFVVKLGLMGRGKLLFKEMIGYVSQDNSQSEETFRFILKDFVARKFIQDHEAKELFALLETKLTTPSLYSSILDRAHKLIHESLSFVVRVGQDSGDGASDPEVQRSSKDVGRSNPCYAVSPYWDIIERFEGLLSDDMKFKECCVSMSGCQLVDLFYKALDVEVTGSNIFNKTAFNNTSTTSVFDNSVSNLGMTLNETSLAADTTLSTSKVASKRTNREPVVKKTSAEDMARSYKCIRDVSELFVELVPIIHKKDIKDNPLIAAIHHNDCLYVAHHLSMLEHHMRPEKQEQKAKRGQPKPVAYHKLVLGVSFFDLQRDLKKLAQVSLESYLSYKHKEIEKIFSSAKNGGDCYKNLLDALSGVKDKIFELQKSWRGVLDLDTLHKSIGALVSRVVQVTIDHIVELSTEFQPAKKSSIDTSIERRSLLIEFVRASFDFLGDQIIFPLFEDVRSSGRDEVLSSNVSNWKKFQELRFLIEPFVTCRRVTDRWCRKKNNNFVIDQNIVGKVVLVSEVRGFLCIVFSAEELLRILKIFG